MAFTEEEKKLLRKLNKRMSRFEKAGADGNVIQQTKNLLQNWYLKYMINMPKSGGFTTRNLNSPEAQEELLNIAKMMDRAKSSNIGYYKKYGEARNEQQIKSYETMKAKYPNLITDYASYVKFIDRLENEYKTFREYYDDSKELARIYDYGYAANLKTKEIQDLIKKQIRYGKKTPLERREDKTIQRINKYVKEMNAVKKEGSN